MPRSLRRLAFITLNPTASNNCATLQPITIFRRCPKCNGLFLLGEENSTIIFFFWPISESPYFFFSFIILFKIIGVALFMFMQKFKYPFIFFTDKIKSVKLIFLFNSSAIILTGFFNLLDNLKQGNAKSPIFGSSG